MTGNKKQVQAAMQIVFEVDGEGVGLSVNWKNEAALLAISTATMMQIARDVATGMVVAHASVQHAYAVMESQENDSDPAESFSAYEQILKRAGRG